MKFVCIIPARLLSKRFPRKLMSLVGEKTLLGHVIEAAKKVKFFDQVIVACCCKTLMEEAKDHGVFSILTDPNIANGTKRIIAAINQGIEGDFFINWQADEPFITEKVIEDLIGEKNLFAHDIVTLKKKISKEEAMDESVVKVVTNCNGKALYFSRSCIPFERAQGAVYYKHIGLYGFSRKILDKISSIDDSLLEKVEVLEQLAWLENGMDIHVSETQSDIIGIDTKKDLTNMITKMNL